jgi:sugar/nucleoside kinase (ribokinase family)
MFSPVRLVGIVGEDFPREYIELYRRFKIDTTGLQIVPGRTFRWSGEYAWDMNTRETLSVALNVFESFTPTLPEAYKTTPFVLLANIAPDLQHHVLDQTVRERFVVADTMDLWINIAKPRLLDLLARVHMLILNDGEARQLTGETSLVKAGRRLRELGPRFVAVKKGEHGCLLFGDGGRFFSCPAFPLEEVNDPTGAGDSFAGGLIGWLAATNPDEITFDHLKRAVVFGSVIASFNVEAFSLQRLTSVTPEQIAERLEIFERMTQF